MSGQGHAAPGQAATPTVPHVPPGQLEVRDPEIPVRLVQLWLCDLCLDGEGEECHTPGCSLWIHDVPKPALRGSQGVTVLGLATEPFTVRQAPAAEQRLFYLGSRPCELPARWRGREADPDRAIEVAPGVCVALVGTGDFLLPDGRTGWGAGIGVWTGALAAQPAQAAHGDDAPPFGTPEQAQLGELRALLEDIGVLAANAPEDDAFAVCEDIAMRIAAAEVEPLAERKPDRGDVLNKRFFHLASELENEAASTVSREAAEALRRAAQLVRRDLDTERAGQAAPEWREWYLHPSGDTSGAADAAAITSAAAGPPATRAPQEGQAAPGDGYVTVDARDIAIALNGYAGFTGDPVSFASELHQRLRRTVFAGDVKAAPELAAAELRQALVNVRAALNRQALTYAERIREARGILRAALDGKP